MEGGNGRATNCEQSVCLFSSIETGRMEAVARVARRKMVVKEENCILDRWSTVMVVVG